MFCHSFCLDYKAYLKDLEEASQAGFDSLVSKANQLQREIPSLTMEKKGNFESDIDEESRKIIPIGKLKGEYVALRTYGDGNCLFRAASILAFDDENKHPEMRVRTLVELACYNSHYLNVPDIEESIDVQERESAREAEFKKEVCSTCKDTTWASDCHVRALPNVFRRSVKIVFAEGVEYNQTYFNDLNEEIPPRDSRSTLEPLVIMMTATSKTTDPNHFVPLVPAGEVRSLGKGRLKILPIVFTKCLFFIQERSFCLAVIFRTDHFFRQMVFFFLLT